jgi:acyl-coenzyme A synthetase/AMP-(fatty) acid ligase
LIERVGELWNMYGPTETTIWSTAARVVAAPLHGGADLIPIGRPLANTVLRIEDGAGNLVPAGVIGELLIGGAGVARGYRNQPDLTSRAFVLRDEGGVASRWYRTGDLARFRCDGQLEFCGRRDRQIKVRGYRIEPSEIESLLVAQPEVLSSVVIARGATTDDQRLLAFLTLAAGASIDPDVLRSVLRERLPDYMVPSQFTVLPKLPLTPNGKIDHAALARIALPESTANAATAMPVVPMSHAQQRIAVLWKDVLRIDRIGLHDNFFDLGGHSLLLVKIHAGLKREFSRDLPLVELFRHTTVAQQARVMEQTLHA